MVIWMYKDKDNKDNVKEIEWFIIAKNGDGPYILCIPAVLITKKLLVDGIKSMVLCLVLV